MWCNVSVVVIVNVLECNVFFVNSRTSHTGDAIRVMNVDVDHVLEGLTQCKIIDIPQLVTILPHIQISCFIPENRHVGGVEKQHKDLCFWRPGMQNHSIYAVFGTWNQNNAVFAVFFLHTSLMPNTLLFTQFEHVDI